MRWMLRISHTFPCITFKLLLPFYHWLPFLKAVDVCCSNGLFEITISCSRGSSFRTFVIILPNEIIKKVTWAHFAM